jgi:hypothetical protein
VGFGERASIVFVPAWSFVSYSRFAQLARVAHKARIPLASLSERCWLGHGQAPLISGICPSAANCIRLNPTQLEHRTPGVGVENGITPCRLSACSMLSSVEGTLVGGLLPLFSQYRTDRGWEPAARARSACVRPASTRAARIWRPETMLLITRIYIRFLRPPPSASPFRRSSRHTLVVVEALARTGLLDASCNSRQGLKFFGYRTPNEAMPAADAVYTSDHLVHSDASPGQRGAGLLSSV